MLKKRLCSIVLALTVLVSPRAVAKETDVFQQPGNFTIKAQTFPPPPGQPAEYGPSGTKPNWSIAQWGGGPDGKLSPFRVTHQGVDVVSTSSSPGASVVVKRGTDGSESYTLSQNGAVLPCETGSGQPQEFDLFASPNVSTVPAADSNAYSVPNDRIALTKMSHLSVSATVSMRYSSLSVPKSCNVSQGGALVSVILNNLVAHQTLFYQLGLGVLCGPQPSARARACEAAEAHPQSNFFFKKNPFGVDDALPLLGQPWLANGQTRTINVDILPRLLLFIRSGPAGMDHDPAHWVLGSYYNGQHIWGDVALSTTWKNAGLSLSTPN